MFFPVLKNSLLFKLIIVFICSFTGFIFGVWNSHTSVGNIMGTLIAGNFVEHDWSLSFTVLGVIMIVLSVVIFLFLISEPTTTRNTVAKVCSRLNDLRDILVYSYC